jgi:hypothetical protein
MKVCPKCRKNKPLEDFYKSNGTPDGRQYVCIECQKLRWSKYGGQKRTKDIKYKADVHRIYGVSGKQLEILREKQNNCCAGCGHVDDPTSRTKKLQLDHDHISGKPRGLLCGNCNKTLGLIGDNPKVLRNLADYLEKPPIETEE